jgi:hypothetical protein
VVVLSSHFYDELFHRVDLGSAGAAAVCGTEPSFFLATRLLEVISITQVLYQLLSSFGCNEMCWKRKYTIAI